MEMEKRSRKLLQKERGIQRGENARLLIEYFQKEKKIINAKIDKEMVENSEKCKLLFSKQPFLWCGIKFFVSGYEIFNKCFYTVECKNALFFSPVALRSLFCTREGVSPSGALALSYDGDDFFARLVTFSGAEESELVLALGAIACRAFW